MDDHRRVYLENVFQAFEAGSKWSRRVWRSSKKVKSDLWEGLSAKLMVK